VWAICHCRGDADQGASWYTNGKFESKNNTFLDVASCITHLVDVGLVDSGRIALLGRSAGGLVVGNAILSEVFKYRPKTVIGQVPFIDPIYDLIDPTVPWTAYEWFQFLTQDRMGKSTK
jgi:oligopeptidase B